MFVACALAVLSAQGRPVDNEQRNVVVVVAICGAPWGSARDSRRSRGARRCRIGSTSRKSRT
eukprot:7629582-Pyramimonas_sp.AAC.1